MPREPRTLSVSNVDLHYHAGMEREGGCTVADYLHHAEVTGRRVLGVTDHDFYLWGDSAKVAGKTYPYEFDLNGLRQFHDEVRHAAVDFSELVVLFSIEISSDYDLPSVPDVLLDMCDFIICEAPELPEDPVSASERYIRRIREIRCLMDRAGKPAFMAHPFRESVERHVASPPAAGRIAASPGRPDLDFTDAELSSFLGQDVRAMAKACSQHGVAVEVNGQTYSRVQAWNIPILYDLLCSADRLLREEGVELLPGSDQHTVQSGRGSTSTNAENPVPWQVFARLETGVDDMPLVRRLVNDWERRNARPEIDAPRR